MLEEGLSLWHIHGTAKALGPWGGHELFTSRAPGWPILLRGRRCRGKRPGLILTTDLLQGLDLQRSEPHKAITALPIMGCRDTPSTNPPAAGTPRRVLGTPLCTPTPLMVHD